MIIKIKKISSVFEDENRRSGIGDATYYFISKKDAEFITNNTINFEEFLIKSGLIRIYPYEINNQRDIEVYKFLVKTYNILYKGEEVKFEYEYVDEVDKDYIDFNKINSSNRVVLKNPIKQYDPIRIRKIVRKIIKRIRKK